MGKAGILIFFTLPLPLQGNQSEGENGRAPVFVDCYTWSITSDMLVVDHEVRLLWTTQLLLAGLELTYVGIDNQWYSDPPGKRLYGVFCCGFSHRVGSYYANWVS